MLIRVNCPKCYEGMEPNPMKTKLICPRCGAKADWPTDQVMIALNAPRLFEDPAPVDPEPPRSAWLAKAVSSWNEPE